MTIMLRPDQERAIQEAIEAGLIDSVDQLIDSALQALTRKGRCWQYRQEAVRRMQEFGQNHHLSLGETVTRKLLHEGHRL